MFILRPQILYCSFMKRLACRCAGTLTEASDANAAAAYCRNDHLVSAATAGGTDCQPVPRPAGAVRAFATAAALVSAPILMQQQQLQQQHAQAGTAAQQDSAGSDLAEHAAQSSQQRADDGPARDAAAAAEPRAAAAAAAAAANASVAGQPPGDESHAGAAAATSIRMPAAASGGMFATAKGKAIQISEAQRRKGEALLAQMDAAGAADPPAPPQQLQKPNSFRAPKPFNRPRPQPVGLIDTITHPCCLTDDSGVCLLLSF